MISEEKAGTEETGTVMLRPTGLLAMTQPAHPTHISVIPAEAGIHGPTPMGKAGIIRVGETFTPGITHRTHGAAMYPLMKLRRRDAAATNSAPPRAHKSAPRSAHRAGDGSSHRRLKTLCDSLVTVR